MGKSGKAKSKKASRKKPPTLTLRQSRLAAAFTKYRTAGEAAIAAGYSPKRADQGAYQALAAIAKKSPEFLNEHGLTIPAMIEKHLVPQLHAKETKFFQKDGKVTDYVEVEDWGTQQNATDMVLRMHGAYAPKDVELAAQVGVKVVILDAPRPQRGVIMADVGPGALPPVSGNGHKP